MYEYADKQSSGHNYKVTKPVTITSQLPQSCQNEDCDCTVADESKFSLAMPRKWARVSKTSFYIIYAVAGEMYLCVTSLALHCLI